MDFLTYIRGCRGFGSRLGLPKLVSFVPAGNFLFAASNDSQICLYRILLVSSSGVDFSEFESVYPEHETFRRLQSSL
ncbi:hypothetical protein OROHE_016819 [Orobanche hederae]